MTGQSTVGASYRSRESFIVDQIFCLFQQMRCVLGGSRAATVSPGKLVMIVTNRKPKRVRGRSIYSISR